LQEKEDMTRIVPRRLVVTSNALAADDNDLSTPRFWRDPAFPNGTGQRAPLVRIEMIKVPNDPSSVAAYGRFSLLFWCDACASYQHPDTHPCTAPAADMYDSGAL